MLRFSLYAMTQPMQFTIFTAEILANRFESSALVAGNLYERLANAAVDRRHLITEPGDHPAELAELIRSDSTTGGSGTRLFDQ
ncbi:MAG: hypothetical protein WAN44_18220, partial [Propionibacteriaceae bacterium]